jgi:DeoR family transcriptional regulator, fructose operon transcriptional repressor
MPSSPSARADSPDIRDKMTAGERRKSHILERISSADTVAVGAVAEALAVSEMTIRRDLAELEKEGLIKRVHGGAVSAHGRSYEPPYTLRHTQAIGAKQRMAALAAGLVEEGDSLALDVGSSVLELARHLAERRGLTVITPSLRAALALTGNKHIRTIVSGGAVRTGEESMVGDLAVRAFADFFVDKLFLGVGGIDARNGLTEYNWEDALVKKAMIRSAKRVYLLADASKFNRVAFAAVCGLADIHALVTNKEPPPDLLSKLRAGNVAVHVAGGTPANEG